MAEMPKKGVQRNPEFTEELVVPELTKK